jgi:hypothetical protein
VRIDRKRLRWGFPRRDDMQAAVIIAVALLMQLLPVQCFVLPLNMAAIDLFGLAALPVCWLWLLQRRQPIRLPYLPAMLLILGASGVACITSLDPATSLVVLVKEVYLYVLFATLTCVFEGVGPRAGRWLLIAWCAACAYNGALILAQLVSPPLLDAMNQALAGRGSLDPFRPSGLEENSNAAALFQFSAFVPLLVLRLPPVRTAALAVMFLLMMLGTGSMGAALAFATGFVALLAGLGVMQRNWPTAFRLAAAVALAAAALVAVLLVLEQLVPAVQDRLRYVLTGRSEYSAEGRFAIWSRGSLLLMSNAPLTGVGPDVFKEIDGHELHNDLLSFAVERGPAALLGLLLLAALVARRGVLLAGRFGARGGLVLLAAPASLVGMATIAQTHEVFHQRPVWLVMALLDGLWLRTQGAGRGAPAAVPAARRAPLPAHSP